MTEEVRITIELTIPFGYGVPDLTRDLESIVVKAHRADGDAVAEHVRNEKGESIGTISSHMIDETSILDP